jgi:hypothetical protein
MDLVRLGRRGLVGEAKESRLESTRGVAQGLPHTNTFDASREKLRSSATIRNLQLANFDVKAQTNELLPG